jgi:hypothetical protein
MDTPLRFGDRDQSIESPREGYLYVAIAPSCRWPVGRRTRSSLPNTPVGNNKVRPGKLIDIPA